MALPQALLAIEVDGFAFQSTLDRFQRNRTRQNALTGLGWRVLRFAWSDLVVGRVCHRHDPCPTWRMVVRSPSERRRPNHCSRWFGIIEGCESRCSACTRPHSTRQAPATRAA
ncbi:MAG: hypothetical protein M3070_12965 [Actinomycetota bacterium]|nr:hypothetical protein [Actinomycetota bacterium]